MATRARNIIFDELDIAAIVASARNRDDVDQAKHGSGKRAREEKSAQYRPGGEFYDDKRGIASQVQKATAPPPWRGSASSSSDTNWKGENWWRKW